MRPMAVPTKAPAGDAAFGERLADEIHGKILLGEYADGSWLRHGALADEYGVSRTPVREALRILQARGAVEIRRNRGAQVRAPSPRDVRELADVRAELEGYAAELAAERIRDEQLDRLDAFWHGYRDAVEEFILKPSGSRRERLGRRWFEANREFHRLIQEAAGNRQLANLLEDVYGRFPHAVTYAALSGDSRLLRRNAEEHDRIAAAIRDRDPAAARAAMRDHVGNAGAIIARWSEDQLERDEAR